MGNLVKVSVVVNDIITVSDNQYICRGAVFHPDFVWLFNKQTAFGSGAVACHLDEGCFQAFDVVEISFYFFDVFSALSLNFAR